MSDSDQHSNNKKLYHIFPAGNGNNVLYINAIKRALDPYFKQTVFVSVSSPVKDKGYKLWFHPFTDLFRAGNQNKILSIFRYGLRYIEFFCCFFIIWVKCFFERPHYLNLSTATLLKLEYYFIKAIKSLGVKPIYTIHDAQLFEVGYKRMSAEKLKSFYLLFDHIIVHNNLSRDFAVEQFKLKQDIFIQFPFPPMDLKDLKSIKEGTGSSVRKFLFIGAFKKEKGYDDLINAWKLINKDSFKHTNYELVLAGVIPQGIDSLIDSSASIANFKVINKYLTDDEFISFISNADVVVLPYRVGTNSGVLSTVMSLGKIVICSDIPSLQYHPLVLKENIFPAGNIEALKTKMVEYINCPPTQIQQMKEDALKRFGHYKMNFQQETVSAFKPLINQ